MYKRLLFIDHLRKVLLVPGSNNLFANVYKCTFCVNSIVFLGFIVNQNGAHVDLEKIEVIQEWSKPYNVGEVRSFI